MSLMGLTTWCDQSLALDVWQTSLGQPYQGSEIGRLKYHHVCYKASVFTRRSKHIYSFPDATQNYLDVKHLQQLGKLQKG